MLHEHRQLRRRSDALGFIEPMLPTLVSSPPEGDDWQHEIKYDGYRTQLIIEPGRSRAFTRNGLNWSDQYRCTLKAAEELSGDRFILDGEMIVQDEHGRSDFAQMRSAIAREPERLVFYAFDLLWLDRDLRREPLVDRRERLHNLIGTHDPGHCLQFSAHTVGGGPAFFEAAAKWDLEGIVSKKMTSRYSSGRSSAWLKTKAFTEGEFVVIGHDRGDGPPLALLARETPEGLEYAGSAFVTLGGADRERFWRAMDRLACEQPALASKSRSAQWVRPELRVRAKQLRGAGKLRHATLSGIVQR